MHGMPARAPRAPVLVTASSCVRLPSPSDTVTRSSKGCGYAASSLPVALSTCSHAQRRQALSASSQALLPLLARWPCGQSVLCLRARACSAPHQRGAAAALLRDLEAAVARKAVLPQRAQLAKLREAHRHAAADGLGRLEHRLLAGEQNVLGAHEQRSNCVRARGCVRACAVPCRRGLLCAWQTRPHLACRVLPRHNVRAVQKHLGAEALRSSRSLARECSCSLATAPGRS